MYNNRNVNNINIFENANLINNINANASNNNLQNINKIDNINIKNQNIISEKKINNNIFDAIILLYANEKEIRKLISTNIYEDRITKIYFLISKNWIDEYKVKYNYTYVSDILSKYYQYDNYISYEQNLQSFKSINELKNIFQSISKLDNSLIDKYLSFTKQTILNLTTDLSNYDRPENF